MFHFLAPWLSHLWGPFRLLRSYLFLIIVGAGSAAVLTWYLLPRVWHLLPRDKGRLNTPRPELARGKPTGAGLVIVCVLIPVLLLVLPFSTEGHLVVACLVLAMLSGFGDDRSPVPWGELKKGLLDLVIAFLAALVLSGGRSTAVWIPLHKAPLTLPAWLWIGGATALLWLSINATNCSDGVDGLAGSLTLLSLFYMGAFLYIIVGHRQVARYLLVPHNPDGARWAVLVFTAAGGTAGYLWHNAEPSKVLMGDAGSRLLGFLVGVAVLAAGNPFLLIVVAPVVLVNGGTGLVKVALLRLFRKLGFDISNGGTAVARSGGGGGASAEEGTGEDSDEGSKEDTAGDTGKRAEASRDELLPHSTEDRGAGADSTKPHLVVRVLHRYRFPLHDHCRKNLHWSNAQVLLRFVLLQAFLTPLLMGLIVKLR